MAHKLNKFFRGASRIMKESSDDCCQFSSDYGKIISESSANEHVTAWQGFVTFPGCLLEVFSEIFRIADILQHEKASYHLFRRFYTAIFLQEFLEKYKRVLWSY